MPEALLSRGSPSLCNLPTPIPTSIRRLINNHTHFCICMMELSPLTLARGLTEAGVEKGAQKAEVFTLPAGRSRCFLTGWLHRKDGVREPIRSDGASAAPAAGCLPCSRKEEKPSNSHHAIHSHNAFGKPGTSLSGTTVPSHHNIKLLQHLATTLPSYYTAQPPPQCLVTMAASHHGSQPCWCSSLQAEQHREGFSPGGGSLSPPCAERPCWKSSVCIAAILEKHSGFASAKRDADWSKPALILIIKLDDIVFMELNFLMTKKLSVQPNKDKRSSEPAQEAISATNPPHGLLIAPWDGVIGRAGT